MKAILGVLWGALVVGCVPLASYKPEVKPVEGLDWDAAADRLAETLTRAARPSITAAVVNRHYFEFSIPGATSFAYGAPVGVAIETRRVDFDAVTDLELYVNHYVYIYVEDEVLREKILFRSTRDARAFVDLVAAFRRP